MPDAGASSMDGLCCPRCSDALFDDGISRHELRCSICRVTYPVEFGIPDLRTGPDPYLTREEDLAAAGRLAARSTSMDFAALLRSYYAENAKVSEQQALQFTHGVLAASHRAERSLDAWIGLQPPTTPRGVASLLDLGCGTAPLAIAAAQRGMRVLGIDVGLRWLVLARERCRAAGVDVTLVCANAEALPLPAGATSIVAGESILENVADQSRTLAEAHRVLAPGGRLWLTTPNKFSLGPDPHLGLPALGWFPEGVAAAYARRIGAVPPHRRLLSASAIRQLAAEQGFRDVRIALPDFGVAQRQGVSTLVNLGIDAYHSLKRVPFSRRILERIGPSFLVAAVRE